MPLVNTTPFAVPPVTFWMRTLGGSQTDIGYGVATDSSRNVYFSGYTKSEGPGTIWKIMVGKYDSSGTLQWQRYVGGASNDIGRDVAVDSSGNVYVVAEIESDGAGNADFGLFKYDTDGTLIWQRSLGGSNYEWGHGITLDSSNNIYLTGRGNNTIIDDAVIIAKISDCQ